MPDKPLVIEYPNGVDIRCGGTTLQLRADGVTIIVGEDGPASGIRHYEIRKRPDGLVAVPWPP